MGFPSSSAGKESACNAGDPGSSPGEGKGYPLQYSGLEKSMDCMVHVVSKSQTLLSDFHYKLYVDFLSFFFCSVALFLLFTFFKFYFI